MKITLLKFIALTLCASVCLCGITACGKKEEAIIDPAAQEKSIDNSDAEDITLSDVNEFTVDTSALGKTMSSLFNNVNFWNIGSPWGISETYNEYEFTDYVQLMQCSGGTEERDHFIDPLDRSVLDDYDFSKLLDACQGILDAGAKPHLKLGSVPLKYTTDPENGGFKMNKYPPDDYNVYYNYIKALASALVEKFGKDEVLTWRFGVMTEYENKEWFVAKSGDPEDTKIAYFKLYDYTVQALIDAIGEDVFVGAHSMSCEEGLWDEAEFVEHVAQGTNYATGKTGTRICFLSASYYHRVAGAEPGSRDASFVDTIAYLQEAAKKYGLDDLVFGVDEGRMLMGLTKGRGGFDLNNRLVGYTYQGAFDARMYKQAQDNDIDYVSTWNYFGTTETPCVSFYIARHTAEFEGMKRVDTKKLTTSTLNADIQAISAYDEDTKTLRIMAYNFKNSYEYTDKAKLSFEIAAPIKSGKVTVTKRYINDDCNYFDEWQQDRITYNITDDMFNLSPDDKGLSAFFGSASDELMETFYNELVPKYQEASKLIPVTEELKVKRNRLTIEDEIDGNSVVFYEIKF